MLEFTDKFMKKSAILMLYQIKNIHREDQDTIASENLPGDSNTVRVESHAGHWDSQHSKIKELDGDLRTDVTLQCPDS